MTDLFQRLLFLKGEVNYWLEERVEAAEGGGGVIRSECVPVRYGFKRFLPPIRVYLLYFFVSNSVSVLQLYH